MDDIISELERAEFVFRGSPVKIVEAGEGRIRGQNYYKAISEDITVLILSVYEGQLPYYRGWVELFSIDPEFYGSGFDKEVIELISRNSGPGEKLFVEYENDRETAVCLSRGCPVEVTRLGSLMLDNGYTWFKDWYFPEGFNEGGQKLQGEKPIDEEHRRKHLEDIEKRVREFLNTESDGGEYMIQAKRRARKI
ncbi:MAG: DUF1122 family protein [Thermoplasmata archaeon]